MKRMWATLPKHWLEFTEKVQQKCNQYRIHGILQNYSCQYREGLYILCVLDSPIAQSVERRTVNPQVAGSSPARGAKFSSKIGHRQLANLKYSPIAQSVERRTVNPQVAGSSPARGARNSKKGTFARKYLFLFHRRQFSPYFLFFSVAPLKSFLTSQGS